MGPLLTKWELKPKDFVPPETAFSTTSTTDSVIESRVACSLVKLAVCSLQYQDYFNCPWTLLSKVGTDDLTDFRRGRGRRKERTLSK